MGWSKTWSEGLNKTLKHNPRNPHSPVPLALGANGLKFRGAAQHNLAGVVESYDSEGRPDGIHFRQYRTTPVDKSIRYGCAGKCYGVESRKSGYHSPDCSYGAKYHRNKAKEREKADPSIRLGRLPRKAKQTEENAVFWAAVRVLLDEGVTLSEAKRCVALAMEEVY